MVRTDKAGRGGYEVGYRRPPKATRFVPGVSGNSKGRPKGARGFAAQLMAAFQKKIVVTDNGRTRKLTTFEVVLRRLANDAMRGEPSAIKLWLALAERYLVSSESPVEVRDLVTEDFRILAEYLPDFGGTDGGGSLDGEENEGSAGAL
jgi:Family of unknown function (DUF5681)